MADIFQTIFLAATYSWQHYLRQYLSYARRHWIVSLIIAGVGFILIVWLFLKFALTDADESEPVTKKSKPSKEEKKRARAEVREAKDKIKHDKIKAKAVAMDRKKQGKIETKAAAKDNKKQDNIKAKAVAKDRKKQDEIEAKEEAKSKKKGDKVKIIAAKDESKPGRAESKLAKKEKKKAAQYTVKHAKQKATSKKKQDNNINREQMAGTEYELLTERILKLKGKKQTVLLAAAGTKTLPVTIPVNVAIELVGKKKRCLLIDLDLKRDAIAKALDISDKPGVSAVQPGPCETEFKDLVVWPAHNFARSKHMNIKALADAASEKFDLVLINAPYLDGSPDRNLIAMAADYGFIFTQSWS